MRLNGLNNRCERATSGEAKDDLNQPKTKTCKECGNTYPVDYKRWRWKDYGYIIKPLPRCKLCHRKYEAQKQRECRARKHQQNN